MAAELWTLNDDELADAIEGLRILRSLDVMTPQQRTANEITYRQLIAFSNRRHNQRLYQEREERAAADRRRQDSINRQNELARTAH